MISESCHVREGGATVSRGREIGEMDIEAGGGDLRRLAGGGEGERSLSM